MIRPEARHGLAALVALAYLGASAWLIRAEGEAHRRRLREGRSALARVSPPAVPSPPAETSPPAEVRPVATPPAVAPAPTVAAQPAGPPPAPPAEANPPTRAPGPVEVREAAPIVAAVPKAAPPPTLDPFWELADQKKVWDLDRLTPEDERRLGAALHRMVLYHEKPVDLGPLPRRVEEAAEPLLKAPTRDGLKYTFTVLDSDESSAFSHPGGYIYVNRGIFDWVAEEEDYALTFLLAHEMAHVELGHALNCLRDPEVRAIPAATVPLFYSLIIPWGYKPDQDFEADRWAWKRMAQAGRSRREVLAFLRKLDDHAERNGFANRRRTPPEDPRIAPLDHHLRSHPLPRLRLKSLSEAMDPPPRSG